MSHARRSIAAKEGWKTRRLRERREREEFWAAAKFWSGERNKTVPPIDDEDMEDRLKGSIDMTPTAEGFKNIAATFCQDIIKSTRADRREAVTELLSEVIRIAGHLGQKDPQKVLDLESWVKYYGGQ